MGGQFPVQSFREFASSRNKTRNHDVERIGNNSAGNNAPSRCDHNDACFEAVIQSAQ